MDGVLVEDRQSILDMYGLPIPTPEDYAFKGENIEDVYPEKVTKEDLHRRMDYDYWVNLPPSEDCLYIIGLAEKIVGPLNVGILTSPVHTLGCETGKRDWVKKHLPFGYANRLIPTSAKYFCAHPHALLVDDRTKNVRAFREHGGQAFLWPQPWNHARRHEKVRRQMLVGRFNYHVGNADLLDNYAQTS